MTYREYVLSNWKQSATYLRAKILVEQLQKRVDELEPQVAMAERGEIPDHPFFPKDGNFAADEWLPTWWHSPIFTDPKQAQLDTWEREALEADQRRQDKLARFLGLYRDGELFGKEWKTGESLRELKQRLAEAQAALENCQPTPVWNWTVSDLEKGWYERALPVLTDMLVCLNWSTFYSFDTEFANFIEVLTDFSRGFSLTIRATDIYGSCTVTNRHVPKQRIHRRGDDMWTATLRALLDFIDAHWETLFTAAYLQTIEDI